MAERYSPKSSRQRRRSSLRVEALEQRQLLATVTGAGTEVGSNITNPDGRIYDQILMTGASVTVTADPGQVTRVSFLDLQGDIVQAEFAGKGTLVVSLDQFKTAAPAANYNQPGVNYVGGLASFTIQGEDATTNFSVFSIGSLNAVNKGLFTADKTGGNHLADVARLTIVADQSQVGGSAMGGIRAGNAIFSDTSNAVGVIASGVNVRDAVIIGDLDASGAGFPTLTFGTGSQFGNITLSGGDLTQTNSLGIIGSGFTGVSSVNGTDSAGGTLRAQAPNAAALALIDGDLNVAGLQPVNAFTLDATTTFDLTGMTQADLNSAFAARTFSNDFTINGNLAAGLILGAAEFRGNVTFAGTVAGAVTIDGAVKTLTFNKGLGAAFKAASIGNVTVSGGAVTSVGAVVARSIGNVSITGDFGGMLSTDYDGSGSYTTGEKAIGNITITGNDSGRVIGVLGIGNVTIGGNVTGGAATGSNTGVAYRFVTLSESAATSGETFKADIGMISITGDLNLRFSAADLGAGTLIDINRGTFGNITVGGAGTLSSTDLTVPNFLGAIRVDTALTAKSGSITVTDGASLTLGEIKVGGASTLGDIKLTSGGAAGNFITVQSSTNSGSSFALSGLTLAGAEQITINNLTARTIGSISATTIDSASAAITLAGNLNGTVSVGPVSLNAGTRGAVAWNGDVGASTTATALTTVGPVSVTAATTTFAADKGIVAKAGLTSFTANGNVVFSAVSSSPNFELGGTAGPLVFNGNTTFSGAGTKIAVISANDGLSTLDTISSLTFNGLVMGGTNTEVRASAIGALTIKGTPNTGQALVTNFNVQVTNNGNATAGAGEVVARDGSNLASYAIGNISVQNPSPVGISNTQLFSGANTFFALGKMGDLNIQSGGGANVATSLFGSPAALTAGAAFVVGDGDNTLNNAAGIDFDGDGTIGTVSFDPDMTAAQETTASFSGAAGVSIGNVNVTGAGGSDRLIGAGGLQTGADGLLILAGVRATTGTVFSAIALSRIDSKLVGTIGTIQGTDLSVQLSVSAGAFTTTTVTTPTAGIIAAAGSATQTGASTSNIGRINGTAVSFANPGDNRVIGNDATDVTATDATTNEIVVIRI